MLSAQGHTAVDAADPVAVREGIARCLARWRESGPEDPALPRSPYTVKAAVDRLITIGGKTLLEREEARCHRMQGRKSG